MKVTVGNNIMKKAILAVTNDIHTDQRVNKAAKALYKMGFQVMIVGVKRKDSHPFSPSYAVIKRIPLIFHKGFLFYAEYNIKLLIVLISRQFNLIVSNDLDTLPACHLAAFLKKKPLVYDSHEYFCGSPEIVSRPAVFRFWKLLEKWLFPRQKTIITVNESIASLYEKEYGKTVYVVRNIPPYRSPVGCLPADELSLPPQKDIILLQGSGINIDRGAEELLLAMFPEHGLKNVLLVVIGSGDVFPKLKEMARHPQLKGRVQFFNRMSHDLLYEYTRYAKIGVSLDKDTNLNYRYSLPNKLFDYIMAGTPQLATDLPEVAAIIRRYNTGLLIHSHAPAHIAKSIQAMLDDRVRFKKWEDNCMEAAKELCWENEEQKLIEIYTRF
jgi:glycosyltransferase involved in cell wall biosynthesis